jgi:hypothetical protein
MAIVSLGVAVQMIVVIAQDGAAWQRAWLTTAQEAMDGPEGLFLENVFEKDIDQYERMQAAIPAGEPFIARMSKPFLLDFNRNLVYVIGYPGMSSPRPGMPISEGGEALSDYLLDQSVRYVAYSQFDEAGFQRRWYGDRVYGDSPWERTEARLAYDFHANVWELAASRKRIYDDGEIFVLDLAQPADSFELPD